MPEPDGSAELEQTNPLEGNPYREFVEGLSQDAPHFNRDQLAHSINGSMIEAIVKDAQEGKFTYERRKPDTNLVELGVYSVDDIMGQLDLALQAIDMSPNDALWKNYISRSNGLRPAIGAVMANRRLAEPFRFAVYRRQGDIIKQKDLNSNGVEAGRQNSELYEKAAEDLGEEGVEAAGVSVEADAARRLITEVPNNKERNERDPYNYLRSDLPPVTRETNPKYYDKFVTNANKELSLGTLQEAVKANPQLATVLEAAGLTADSLQAVDAIREDADVRFNVAKLLASKLNMLATEPDADLGWRILDNNPNNLKADQIVVKKLMSRTHAVELALKMIDGEYSEQHGSSSDYERDSAGKIAIGQHRHAAIQTLMTYR